MKQVVWMTYSCYGHKMLFSAVLQWHLESKRYFFMAYGTGGTDREKLTIGSYLSNSTKVFNVSR